jgi:hypothetical protein
VARTRTTKKLAQRIDLNYFKRPTPLKRAKFWLSLLLPLLALVWIAERTIFKDSRVYSSGRLSEPHAVLEKECATCHVQTAGAFSSKAADSACLGCHDGPVHHTVDIVGRREIACAECHTEHRGRVDISAASNQSCAECHLNLGANGGSSHYASNIRSFEDGHPEFAAARNGARDLSNIKLNHAIHMKQIRRSPTGPLVQLDCADCHRPAASPRPTTYSDANYVGAKISYGESPGPVPSVAMPLMPFRPSTGRELMAPVRFANACAACHLLTFDKRFEEGVPHDRLDVVHAFLVKKFSAYIAAYPNELREMQDPARDLTGKPFMPGTRTVTSSQWVREKVIVAEELLWHKTCSQCHAIVRGSLASTDIARWSAGTVGWAPRTQRVATILAAPGAEPPQIAPALTTLRWMPHAKFDHSAHTGFTCISCHSKALTSTESTDILIPGIATCQKCHAPGPEHAESRCFECHTYHDWSKRKEITPKFALPALRTGGR